MEIDTFHLSIILIALFVSGGGCAVLVWKFWDLGTKTNREMQSLRNDLAASRIQIAESMKAKSDLMRELEETKKALHECRQEHQ
jgi:hypothetical protein